MKIKARRGDTIEATKPFGQLVEGEVLIIVREVGYPNTRRIILSKQQASELAHALGGCEGKNAEKAALYEAQEALARMSAMLDLKDETVKDLGKRLSKLDDEKSERIAIIDRQGKRIKALEARIRHATDMLTGDP